MLGLKVTKNRSFFSYLVLCLALYTIFAFLTYKQYGVTADEETEYKAGAALLVYYRTGEDPKNFALFERLLPSKTPYFEIYSATLNLLNPSGYFEHFHLLNLLFAASLLIILYLWLYYEYKNPLLSAFGSLLILATPRFFGDIPANPKDVPFAIIYFLGLALIYFSDKIDKKLIKILALGIVFGLAIGMRTVGLTLLLVYFIFCLVRFGKKRVWVALAETCGILLVSITLMLLLWPYFRVNFPQSTAGIITNAASFDPWNKTMLFFGKYLTKYQRPQSYLPVWLVITLPIWTLFSFIASLFGAYIISLTKKPLYILIHTTIFINLALYFIVKPVVYNGLRHFLYLVIPIVFISFIFLIDLLRNLKGKSVLLFYVVIAAFSLNVIFIVRSMVVLHPYEYIYFNELAGGLKGAQQKFELDYWGATYKEASEWLRNNVSQNKMDKVYACNVSKEIEYFSHAKYQPILRSKDADYIVCDVDNDRLLKFEFPIVHTVNRDGVTLNIIRKVPKSL